MTITDPLDRNPQPGAWAIYREIFEARRYGDVSPITDEELEEAYGPQWEAVLDLVREAALFTEEQRSTYWTAIDEARKSDDYRTAYQAVLGYDGPGVAARRALGSVGVGGDDASVAAALARRHEIGIAFTQVQYDLLVAPWVAITRRPVHAADATVAA